MTERIFSLEDQADFAKISGDYNPLHMDPILARRLMYGKLVVHGIHAVLWALDVWLKEKSNQVILNTLKVDFNLPIAVNESIQTIISKDTEDQLNLNLIMGGSKVLKIKATFSPSIHQKQRTSRPVLDIGECKIIPVEELSGVSGKVPLNFDSHLADKLFPNVNRLLSPIQIAELLAITRIVGMECPGFNSLFSGFSFEFTDPVDNCAEMSFQVVEVDVRFSMVVLIVSSVSAAGKLHVFYRPSYKQQPSYMNIKKLVTKEEFAGQRAVIIGGSRGLGEVTAKLLSAGGAEVVITYFRGSKDANKVVDEIAASGGKIYATEYDVMSPPVDFPILLDKEWRTTHLYYFATPFIFEGKRGVFNPSLYDKFCNYYVKGFINTIQSFKNAGYKFKKVFYPSSTSIEELPEDMMEYTAAKAAGESICQFMNKIEDGTKFMFPRLERLDTDQTASVFQVINNDPVSRMLTIIRELN